MRSHTEQRERCVEGIVGWAEYQAAALNSLLPLRPGLIISQSEAAAQLRIQLLLLS